MEMNLHPLEHFDEEYNKFQSTVDSVSSSVISSKKFYNSLSSSYKELSELKNALLTSKDKDSFNNIIVEIQSLLSDITSFVETIDDTKSSINKLKDH